MKRLEVSVLQLSNAKKLNDLPTARRRDKREVRACREEIDCVNCILDRTFAERLMPRSEDSVSDISYRAPTNPAWPRLRRPRQGGRAARDPANARTRRIDFMLIRASGDTTRPSHRHPPGIFGRGPVPLPVECGRD